MLHDDVPHGVLAGRQSAPHSNRFAKMTRIGRQKRKERTLLSPCSCLFLPALRRSAPGSTRSTPPLCTTKAAINRREHVVPKQQHCAAPHRAHVVVWLPTPPKRASSSAAPSSSRPGCRSVASPSLLSLSYCLAVRRRRRLQLPFGQLRTLRFVIYTCSYTLLRPNARVCVCARELVCVCVRVCFCSGHPRRAGRPPVAGRGVLRSREAV